mmetsp:Transcript_15760/g.20182  ORF Transcript_15760/g.20182 Transcript_15760/m.20182 type:complete len:777 (-) Transcript_15760:285-2615(-)
MPRVFKPKSAASVGAPLSSKAKVNPSFSTIQPSKEPSRTRSPCIKAASVNNYVNVSVNNYVKTCQRDGRQRNGQQTKAKKSTKEKEFATISSSDAEILKTMRTVLKQKEVETLTLKSLMAELQRRGLAGLACKTKRSFIMNNMRKILTELNQIQSKSKSPKVPFQNDVNNHKNKPKTGEDLNASEKNKQESEKEQPGTDSILFNSKKHKLSMSLSSNEDKLKRQKIQETIFRGNFFQKAATWKVTEATTLKNKASRRAQYMVKMDPREYPEFPGLRGKNRNKSDLEEVLQIKLARDTYNDAWSCQVNKRYNDAISLYTDLSIICNNNEVLQDEFKHFIGRAFCYIQLRQYSQAMNDLVKVEESKKGIYQVAKFEGMIHLTMGFLVQAKKIFEKALKKLQHKRRYNYHLDKFDVQAEEQELNENLKGIKKAEDYLSHMYKNPDWWGSDESNWESNEEDSAMKFFTKLSPESPRFHIVIAVNKCLPAVGVNLLVADQKKILKEAFSKCSNFFLSSSTDRNDPLYAKSLSQLVSISQVAAKALHGRGLYELAEIILRYLLEIITWDPLAGVRRISRLFASMREQKELGNLHFSEGRYLQAYEVYSTALHLDPSNTYYNAQIYFNRGSTCLNLFQYKKAVEDCTCAIRLQNDYVKAYIVRGKAQMGLKHFQAAVEDFEEAYRLSPLPSTKELLEKARESIPKPKPKPRQERYQPPPRAPLNWGARDPYLVLGVKKYSDYRTCRKAWKAKVLQYHPDKKPGNEDHFKEVSEAWSRLKLRFR